MRQRIGYSIFAACGVGAAAVGGWAGRTFPFAEQVQLLRELREVSTIIFGVVGAWAAIAYPEELKRKLRATETMAIEPERLHNFRLLMRCIVISAGIVCVLLAIQFGAPIIARLSWATAHIELMRGTSFSVGCVLATVQIWLVLFMLVPMNVADADVRAAQETQSRLTHGPQGKVGTRMRL